jgi:hypothetical protein
VLVTTRHQTLKLSKQNLLRHKILRRKDVLLSWLSSEKLKLRKQTDELKKRVVTPSM